MVKLTVPIHANQLFQKSHDHINDAIKAMQSNGFNIRDIKVGNGIQRFSTHERNVKDKSGWYCFDFEDGILFGAFGCWRSDIRVNYISGGDYNLCPVKKHEINLKIKKKQDEQEILRQQNIDYVASKASELIWENSDASYHDYLGNKSIELYHNVKIFKNTLYIPLVDVNNKIWNFQKIYFDSNSGKFEKRYYKPDDASSGRKDGCFYPLYGNNDTILVCEGYATGATLFSSTGNTVICAMDAGNISKVVTDIKKTYPQSRIIICADNDFNDNDSIKQKRIDDKIEQWRGIAEVIMPPRGKTSGYDFNDFALSGGNVRDYLFPTQKKKWLKSLYDLMQDTTPPKFIIHGMIPENSLGMIHGQSGHGKTFFVIDMAYRIATDMDYHGVNVKGGNVIYLAGEGNHNIRFRGHGLMQKHGHAPTKVHVSESGCDLNTPEGYEKVRESIKEIIEETDSLPRVIFIDTLHRFLDGDENSSKDAKTMIDACDRLKVEFNCTVILVHHTGLNSDDRARGSSSWRGSMDFEFNIKKSGNTLTSYCKKMKESDMPNPKVYQLNSVDLIGINHESGEPVTTLVLELAESQEPPNPRDKEDENKIKEDTNTLKACWRECGDVHEGRAFVSYSGLLDYAITYLEKTETQAKNMTKTDSSRFIGRLIEAKVIEKMLHDNQVCYFFLDPALNFSLIHTKKSGNYDDCDTDTDTADIPF